MAILRICDEEMYSYFENLFLDELPDNWKRESKPVFYSLGNRDVCSMLGAKELLYRREDAELQICLLDWFGRFIQQYIGIEGLEELVINNYGSIENSIFFEHDKAGHPVNIREHAKHQMKNAYLGSVLLWDYHYMQDMTRCICEGSSLTTRYLIAQARYVLGAEDEESKVTSRLQEWCYKIFMLSALLHDIGYPLEHYLREAQLLADYPPYLKILSPTIKTDFSEIKALLLNSQLFRQIDNEAIREKYQRNDHGALSAISLLIHFYYGGSIYSLEAEERCIIEMTAIAIYRHTDRFCNGFRMVYLHDPISYMLRLCDDLQEWERFKVVINDKHNYLQCSNCGKILLENNREYSCSCGREYLKVTQLNNRKLSYICLCDYIEIEQEEDGLKIYLHFNPMKQLEILLEDYTAVLKCKKDLEKVQEMIVDQYIYPTIKLDYMLSNNPIYIIKKLIEGREKELKLEIEKKKGLFKDNLKAFFKDFQDRKDQDEFGGAVETNSLKYREKAKAYVKKYFGEIYSVYNMLNK